MAKAKINKRLKIEMDINLKRVQLELNDMFGIDIMAKNRSIDYVTAREYFVRYVSGRFQRYSTSQIGAYMNKDHATILHARKKFEDHSFIDESYREKAHHIFLKLDLIMNQELTMQPIKDQIINYVRQLDALAVKQLWDLLLDDTPNLIDLMQQINSDYYGVLRTEEPINQISK